MVWRPPGMVWRPPGMVSGWSGVRRVAPAPAIGGSGEVFMGGRERVAGNFAGGRSGALSMASAATSSSDDVYGDPFLGRTLPPNGPLPLSIARLPSVGPGGLGAVGLCGRFKAGSRLGLIAPGMEGAPDWPELSSPRDILRACWDNAPPRSGGRTERVSTRPGVVASAVLLMGGRPCN